MSSLSASHTPLLEMRNIGKSFAGVRALDGVSLELRAGEIHALVGENGAGKSTLIKILNGVYPHGSYAGEIVMDGSPRQFKGVRDAERAGLAVVFQELSLVPELSVAENVFLGRAPGRFGVVDWDELNARVARLFAELQLEIDPGIECGSLGTGRQQLVEIAKALSHNARILVLDEPTAALTDAEAEHLFLVLMRLRKRGIAVIYISHRLEEVFRLADFITVLRDGQIISTCPAAETTPGQVIARMVGREVSQIFPESKRKPGEIAFEVRHWNAERSGARGDVALHDVNFSVRRGEVLGIAGLMGAGRTELLMSLFGVFPGRVSGEVRMGGRPVEIRAPAEAMAHGIGFVTEDRKRSGLILEQTIVRNMTLAALTRINSGWTTDEAREIAACRPLSDGLHIKAASLFTACGKLSGGNQQKVVLGKWLLTEPRVLFLDEPTRGIDVGAKQEIYAQIESLAAAGMAVVMVSSELPEVLGICDRILVLHEGRITGEFSRCDATAEAVMRCATGHAARAAEKPVG